MPILLKKPTIQRLKNSNWTAIVLLLQPPPQGSYLTQLTQTTKECAELFKDLRRDHKTDTILKTGVKFEEPSNETLPATLTSNQSTRNETRDTSKQPIPFSKVSLSFQRWFSQFPEDLQKADEEFCIDYNKQLMNKILLKKKKNSKKFIESDLMHDDFVYRK